MKLSELRAALRNTKGNPTCGVDLGNGVPMILTLQKTPLLAELSAVFGGERTAETGLTFDPVTNILRAEGDAAPEADANVVVDAQLDDEDDEFDL